MNSPTALLACLALSALGAGCPWACASQSAGTPNGSSDAAASGDVLHATDGDTRDQSNWSAGDASDASDLGDASDATDDDSNDRAADGDSGDGPAKASKIPTLHRATASACTEARPVGRSCATTGCDVFFSEAGSNCAADQDCTRGSNGRCNCQAIGATTNEVNICSYDQCASDNDCSGGVCVCRENAIRTPTGCSATNTGCFVSGNCHVDSDCGSGGYCSPSPSPGCGATAWYGYFCHTAADNCVNDSDCAQGNAYCAYGAGGHWVCSTGLCPDG